MYLEIYTPDQKIFEGEVISATFPGADGAFQILNNHAPLISALDKGNIRYQEKKLESEVSIDGGVVEVLQNRVVVLVESVVK